MSKGKAFEKAWPQLLAIVIAVSWWPWSDSHPITPAFRDVLNSVSNGSMAACGFLLAAAALLVAVTGSWYKQRAREAGVYSSLVRHLFTAMRWSLALMILSNLGLAYDAGWWKLHPLAVCPWLYVSVVTVGAIIRALSLFAKLFLLIAEEE